MIIRNERPTDIQAITDITIAAFQNHPFSHQTEHFIVHALRAANALAVSLVAEIDGNVAGHVAFSPVAMADGSPGWYGVGPISVAPEYQRQGIGTALMEEGLRRLENMGANGCLLVGDPHFYKRFGFRNIPELILEGVPPDVFLALPFGEKSPRGAVQFHQAFMAME